MCEVMRGSSDTGNSIHGMCVVRVDHDGLSLQNTVTESVVR